jgi:hypothetical protein
MFQECSLKLTRPCWFHLGFVEPILSAKHVAAFFGTDLRSCVLPLQDLMKTKAGLAMAQQRHAFMENYLQQFYLEWEGKA